jgi:MFS superfamily sulfate permease-like transporter
MVLGPDSALAGLIAATILPLAAGDPERARALAGVLALLSGALCCLVGFFRFGFIADLFSKPIRYGYLNGGRADRADRPAAKVARVLGRQ